MDDDQPVPVTDAVNYSTSARSTVGFLLEIVNLWKYLDHDRQDPQKSSSYVEMVVKAITECSIHYVAKSAERLKLFDEEGCFSNHKEVCMHDSIIML